MNEDWQVKTCMLKKMSYSFGSSSLYLDKAYSRLTIVEFVSTDISNAFSRPNLHPERFYRDSLLVSNLEPETILLSPNITFLSMK